MGTPIKPAGYSSVSPYLVVEGAQRVIDFLKRAFDATERRRYDMPDGTIMHAEVQIDDTVVMIADGGGEWPPFPSWLHVYVSDVDATYHRALEAGGVPVQEPKQREGDPDRRGGVKDPGGNTWWIGTQLIILLALGAGCVAPAYAYFTSSGGLSDRAASLGFPADTNYVLTVSRRSEVAITIAGTVGRVSSRWKDEGRFRRVPAAADSADVGRTGAQS